MILRREGWLYNRKRVQRLWRDEGLRLPQGVQFLAIGGTPGTPFSDVIAAREKTTTT